MPTNREYIIMNLAESDPDEVVDTLRISSRELLEAFPEKLESYLQANVGGSRYTGHMLEEEFDD